MLTNKQIAITRLVDAKFKGYTHLELQQSSHAQVMYLMAKGIRPFETPWSYRLNICALKKIHPNASLYAIIEGRTTYIPSMVQLPLDIGPQLIDRYYWFLTYNDG